VRLPRARARRARIEIIPMIDIIFFLLVFFMIATLSMAVYRGLPVGLPAAATGGEVPGEHLAVSVRRDGAIALDREGRGALLRDLGGRTVLLAPHGAHFIVEDLGEGAIAHLDGSRLAVTYGTATKARVTLDLGDDARDWAALVPALD